MGTDRAIEGGDGWCIKAGVGLVLVHLTQVTVMDTTTALGATPQPVSPSDVQVIRYST